MTWVNLLIKFKKTMNFKNYIFVFPQHKLPKVVQNHNHRKASMVPLMGMSILHLSTCLKRHWTTYIVSYAVSVTNDITHSCFLDLLHSCFFLWGIFTPKFTNKADVTQLLNYFTYNGYIDLKKKNLLYRVSEKSPYTWLIYLFISSYMHFRDP